MPSAIRRLIALAGSVALATAGFALSTAPPVSAASSPQPSVQHRPHHHTTRLCGARPAPGHAACMAIRQTDPTPQLAGATPSGFGPADLQSAYQLPSGGSGRTVAIVDAQDDPNAEADLARYRSTYGLPPCTSANGCFSKVNQDGAVSPLPTPDAGWAGEISLDLDMVSATCPACNIRLVEASSSSITDLGTSVNTAVTLGAGYVSNSYGGPEDGSEQANDNQYYRHPGVAITASTGDSGYGASYPATGSAVTAVGGTSLTQDSSSRGWSETAWSSGGSGCSQDVPQPSFQGAINTGCTDRAEADVSAVADPQTGVAVYDTYQAGGWNVYGGTSASSPIIASVYALAGSPGQQPNATPYANVGSLNDITSGSNGTCSATVQCNSGPGWDGPTGLGTPNGTGAFTG